ncbi:hypothetical protein MYMAC_000109 [Corallococcus macrosporus DSM 14697]|uniref:Uncharacterized protein n=1 Tax=Corallococcus macrosporus DSM 14697 TaxID=1189310 RepID=A0A250JLL4_9BACT|nr:hypothetical protein MYMAC_000109 [Corallococcus macrosporus DSM 14697]
MVVQANVAGRDLSTVMEAGNEIHAPMGVVIQ